ncbi:MAG: ComEA family DNA-binding protein, partial [Cyanobacteriota bacterium]|nr:ComEA family DNA-binding protein [Cyanobacteriota bacterium]
LEEIAIAAQLGLKIDVNRASVDDWLRLPGISIHQARSLVELVGMGVQLLCIEDIAAAISVGSDRLKPLEPVLYFCYYDPESFASPLRVNPNNATFEQLVQIPVLDEAIARNLVQNRLSCGAYRNVADLQRRLNLTSAFAAQLMHYLQW